MASEPSDSRAYERWPVGAADPRHVSVLVRGRCYPSSPIFVTGLAPRLNDHPPAFVELSDGGFPSCAEPRRNRNTNPGRTTRRQRVHTDQCAIRLHEHVGLLCRTATLARFTRLTQHNPIRRGAFRRQRATDNRRFEPDRLRLDQVRAGRIQSREERIQQAPARSRISRAQA